MGAVYAAKEAAGTTPTTPPGWPPGWDWPGPPWPPGWDEDEKPLRGTSDGVCTTSAHPRLSRHAIGTSAGVCTASGVPRSMETKDFAGPFSDIEIHGGKLYVALKNGQLHRRDSKGSWALVATAPVNLTGDVVPAMLSFGGDLFVVGDSSGGIYRLDGASFTLETADAWASPIFTNGSYLFSAATKYAPGAQYGGRRDGAGSWTWGICASGVADSLFSRAAFDSAAPGGTYYYTGTDTLTRNSYTNGAFDYMPAVYDSKLWKGDLGDIYYRTTIDGTWTQAVAGDDYTGLCAAALGKLCVLGQVTLGHGFTYDGVSVATVRKNMWTRQGYAPTSIRVVGDANLFAVAERDDVTPKYRVWIAAA